MVKYVLEASLQKLLVALKSTDVQLLMFQSIVLAIEVIIVTQEVSWDLVKLLFPGIQLKVQLLSTVLTMKIMKLTQEQ